MNKIDDVKKLIEEKLIGINSMEELNAIKNKLQIGDTVTLTVYRSGQDLEIKITLTEMP